METFGQGFNAARGFVGGATPCLVVLSVTRISFNAARGFVGGATGRFRSSQSGEDCFNAARGFVGGATLSTGALTRSRRVSMPHAALWVVQLHRSQPLSP